MKRRNQWHRKRANRQRRNKKRRSVRRFEARRLAGLRRQIYRFERAERRRERKADESLKLERFVRLVEARMAAAGVSVV